MLEDEKSSVIKAQGTFFLNNAILINNLIYATNNGYYLKTQGNTFL